MNVLIALALSFSCAMNPVNPTATVEVKKEGSSVAVVFHNCFDPKKLLDMKGVIVTKLVGGKRAAKPHCQLVWTDFNVPSVKSVWHYGTVPPGYKAVKCEPLVPGETYEARVEAGAGGSAVFSMEKDGSVRMIEQECK